MTHEIQRWLAHRLGSPAWTKELWFCQDGRMPMRYAYEPGTREHFEYRAMPARWVFDDRWEAAPGPLVPFIALTLPL